MNESIKKEEKYIKQARAEVRILDALAKVNEQQAYTALHP
jgi:hypothetical protein